MKFLVDGPVDKNLRSPGAVGYKRTPQILAWILRLYGIGPCKRQETARLIVKPMAQNFMTGKVPEDGCWSQTTATSTCESQASLAPVYGLRCETYGTLVQVSSNSTSNSYPMLSAFYRYHGGKRPA